MSDFRPVQGFEDALPRPLPMRRTPQATLSRPGSEASETRARLSRVAGRAPEVIVKVNSRLHSAVQLRDHFDYVSRKGVLEMEDRDGNMITGRAAVREMADDWSAAAVMDSRRQVVTPIALSVVLAAQSVMDEKAIKDSSRAFALEMFSEQFEYSFVLHTDGDAPHVHLTIRRLGDRGDRLNPDITGLRTWRQAFALALRDHGVEVEATPRWTRGVTRKSEHGVLRRIRERHEAGKGQPARVLRAAYHDAAKAAFEGDRTLSPWEQRIVERQTRVRNLYLLQAQQLARSSDPADRALGAKVEAFVRSMPPPDSRRLALARELRAADKVRRERDLERGDRER